MDNYNNNWFEKHLISGTDNLESMPLNISNNSKGNNFRNWFNNPLDFKTKIESSSSSTTHISDNICICHNVSMGENIQTHNHDDEEWVNSMCTCISRTLDGTLGEFPVNCSQDISEQLMTMDFQQQQQFDNNKFNNNLIQNNNNNKQQQHQQQFDNLNNYLNMTFGNYNYNNLSKDNNRNNLININSINNNIGNNINNNININNDIANNNINNINNRLESNISNINNNYIEKLQVINTDPNEIKYKEPFEIIKAFNETQLCNDNNVQKSNSPEGTIIFNTINQNGIITSSNVSTDCGVCGFPPVTNTSPSSDSQFSEHTKNATNLCSATSNGFNTPYDILSDTISLSANGNDTSIKGTYGSCTSSGSFNDMNNISRSSNFSFSSGLLGSGQQISGSLLGDILSGNNNPNSLSDITNESKDNNTYNSFNFLSKDMNNTIGENYYKTLRHNKDIDLIFNNMDSISRVDNLLNKDITDFGIHSKEYGIDVIDLNSDGVNDMLNNDALFSEIYRDNEDPEGWDNLMKRLSISNSLTKYQATPINEQSQNPSSSNSVINTSTTSQNTADNSELGINLKNKDNLPTVLPSDPNLGFKKTSLCKYWQRGICANDDCNFAHGKKELRSTIGVWRTTICHHWKTGICRVGKDCRHAHGEEELQPKNIPPNVLKNKLLNSARKYEYMRKKKNTY